MKRSARNPLAWLGGLLALYLVLPLVAFLVRLAGSGERGFTAPGLWSALGVSVLSATISTAIIAVLGIPLAYLLARSRGPLGRIVGTLVQLPLAMPPVMSGIILIYVVGPYTPLGRLFDGRLTGTITGIVIAQTFVASPFLIIAARSAFQAVDPAFDELAATLGHRPLARFWRVGLPAASSGVAAGLVLAWLRALGEYGATVLLAYHPYSLPVFTYVQFSGSGVPTTQAPTALALGIAIAAVGLGFFRLPRRRARPAAVPASRPPRRAEATAVCFDLDVTVGTFRLRLAHETSVNRLAILGPSGSGKSVTLRSLAGLIDLSRGSVRFNGQAVTGVPPEERGVGYVPQGGLLLPGRTVWEQVVFGVHADPRRAAWWLRTLHLDGLEDRLPDQLSGGQRQRVAIAQALSHDPRLVLLDEPFSALDTPVREELRQEIRLLQRDTGFSTVLVTHDPEEAALLADDIVVIADGRLLQSGSRSEVYRRPASPEVARLLGIRNLRTGLAATSTTLRTGAVLIEMPPNPSLAGEEVLWCIRPENVRLHPRGRYPVIVLDVADLGATRAAVVRLEGGPELRVRSQSIPDLPSGSRSAVDLEPEDIAVWPCRASVGAGVVHARP
jgi:molybdate transport system permease protein